MVTWRGLGARDVRGALSVALAAHADVVEDPVDPFAFALFMNFDGAADLDVWLRISPEEVERCAQRIGELTARYASRGRSGIPWLLAGVATAVGRCGFTLESMSADTARLAGIAQEIRADFAILVTVLLARHLGYAIPVASIPKDRLIWALEAVDSASLINLFGHALGTAAPSGSPQDVAGRPFPRAFAESRRRLLQLHSSAFDASTLTRERASELMAHPAMINNATVAELRALRRLIGPVFDAVIDANIERPRPQSATTAGLQITPRSYANLRSVAQVKGWSDATVLRLIEARLNPALSPLHVYHSSTVSGDDWIRLHRRLGL
jgi:hypothetical protein